MDEMFEEVLAICLDRLADGDQVDACVADFPECPELRPLLEIAAALQRITDEADRPLDGLVPEPQPTWLVLRGREDRLRPTG